KRSLAAHVEDMRTLQPAVEEIANLTIAFKEKFTAVKKEKAIVDFSDLEHYCLAILMDASSTEDNIIPSDIAEQYKKQFKEVLWMNIKILSLSKKQFYRL